MSGNNPDILYSLNVLGNATVTGILDCGEVAIDLVDTIAVETASLTVTGTSALNIVTTTGLVAADSLNVTGATFLKYTTIAGNSTAATPVLAVSSASTVGNNIATFLAPASPFTSLAVGNALSPNQCGELAFGNGDLSIGFYGQDPSFAVNGSGDGTITRNLAVSGTTVSTSKTTGAIVSQGGLGVVGATYTDTLNVVKASTATTSAVVVTSAANAATTIASLLAPSAGTTSIILGQTTADDEHIFIEATNNQFRAGVGGTTGYIQVANNKIKGNVEGVDGNIVEFFQPSQTGNNYLLIGKSSTANQSAIIGWSQSSTYGFIGVTGGTTALTFNSTGNVDVPGRFTSLQNCYTYQASTTTSIPASIPTVMLNWQVNSGATNTGEALTYTNADGRFTNNLSRTVVALVTFSGRTDVQVGTLDGYMKFSTLSGPCSSQTVQLGDYISLSASISMAAGAYFTIEAIASVPATWQSTNSIITVTLL